MFWLQICKRNDVDIDLLLIIIILLYFTLFIALFLLL